MYIRELLAEQKLDVTHNKSIPNMSSVGVPPLPMGPTNYYHKYRLGVMMAGAPDFSHDYDQTGQFVDDMVTIGYSKADQEIIDTANKKFGYTPKTVSEKGSHELDSTGTLSPVAQWNKKK